MKTLSIKAPFSFLVATGVKSVEARSWKTAYRGDLVIHCSRTLSAYDRYCAIEELTNIPNEHLGCVVAIVKLVDIVPFTERHVEGCLSDPQSPIEETPVVGPDDSFCPEPKTGYEGVYAWIFEDPRVLIPVAKKGAVGFFDTPDELLTFATKDEARDILRMRTLGSSPENTEKLLADDLDFLFPDYDSEEDEDFGGDGPDEEEADSKQA